MTCTISVARLGLGAAWSRDTKPYPTLEMIRPTAFTPMSALTVCGAA